MISLNYRCLEPGKYASHIERWLQFYKSQQLLIIDGEKLKSDPIYVMNKLQHFLNVQPIVDYEKLLKYDSTKGFYCPISCKYFDYQLHHTKIKKYKGSKIFLHFFSICYMVLNNMLFSRTFWIFSLNTLQLSF